MCVHVFPHRVPVAAIADDQGDGREMDDEAIARRAKVVVASLDAPQPTDDNNNISVLCNTAIDEN